MQGGCQQCTAAARWPPASHGGQLVMHMAPLPPALAALVAKVWEQCGGKSSCPAGAACGDYEWATCAAGSGCQRQSEW